jgi:hypothetical protein
MTGHGDPSTVYQCFDEIENVLKKMGAWMRKHPREVIVIYFGENK